MEADYEIIEQKKTCDIDITDKMSNNCLTNEIESMMKLNALTEEMNESKQNLNINFDNILENLNPIESISDNMNLSNSIVDENNENECDIKSDTSSSLLTLNLSNSNPETIIKKQDIVSDYNISNNHIGTEGIIMPPQPLHPDTYLNFPHYIDYNNFSTNYNKTSQITNSANKTNINNASSALALYYKNLNSITNINCAPACCKEQSLSLNHTNITNVNNLNELTKNPAITNYEILCPSSTEIETPSMSQLDGESNSEKICITDQDTINCKNLCSPLIQHNEKPSKNNNLTFQQSTTSSVTPSISVTIHSASKNCNCDKINCDSSSDCNPNSCNYNNPLNSPASVCSAANVSYMQKCTSQQLNALYASNASSSKFQDNLLAYKRYLFSPKTQSLDLGSDLEHPLLIHNRNPRLQQEERYLDDSLILNEVDELIQKDQSDFNRENNTTTNSPINGDLRREILQKNADEALGAGRLSPSISYGTSSASNNSTMSTGESDIMCYNTTSSATTSPSDSLVNTGSVIRSKTQSALETRPIYPNVPYSPYSSPRSRRRPPLRESRRVSIDKTGSFLQLNQYKLMDQIGQGSYGLVKLAYNEEDSTHYAMKILSKRRLLRKAGLMSRGPKRSTQSPLDRVYREIAVLKKLDHPNVVKLIEVLDDPLEDFLYLVFELVHQGEVLSIPTDKPLNEERAWSVFRDALQGLEYLHFQRIIHADIKPGNLLLGECGQVKIADLGVCNEFLGDDAVMNNGSTAGTPAFRAPETLIPGQHIYSGKAVDIWALGATLWSLIYGNVPFVANNIPTLYEQIKNDPLIFPENPKISDDLKDLLEKLLNKDTSKRIKMPQIKEHPWVTSNNKYPLPSEEDNCRLIQINEDDINSVVKSIPKLDTLILIKTMLKNHSFQNPFTKGGVSGRAPQRGGSRWERFTRAGRSNSAPGSYHSPLDRQLSNENQLPSLTENVLSPSNESSTKLE